MRNTGPTRVGWCADERPPSSERRGIERRFALDSERRSETARGRRRPRRGALLGRGQLLGERAHVDSWQRTPRPILHPRLVPVDELKATAMDHQQPNALGCVVQTPSDECCRTNPGEAMAATAGSLSGIVTTARSTSGSSSMVTTLRDRPRSTSVAHPHRPTDRGNVRHRPRWRRAAGGSPRTAPRTARRTTRRGCGNR